MATITIDFCPVARIGCYGRNVKNINIHFFVVFVAGEFNEYWLHDRFSAKLNKKPSVVNRLGQSIYDLLDIN